MILISIINQLEVLSFNIISIEKYFLISTDNGTIRLETMPLNKLAIQIKENQITLSENDKQPFATLTYNNHIKEKELIFVHKGDFLFQKVEDIV